MEQDIRFCELDGRRIAYAMVGEGPVLLVGGRWVTHLEEEWADPRAGGFLAALARRLRARQLAARRPDVRGPVRPPRQRGRDRVAQPLPTALGRGGRSRGVPRARPDLRRAAVPP